MAIDYHEEMDALMHHKKDSFTVPKDSFMEFRKQWLGYDHRKEIVGEATRNGDVIYRYVAGGQA